MERTRMVVDCALWQAHRDAACFCTQASYPHLHVTDDDGVERITLLPPHTTMVPFTPEEERAADFDATQDRAARAAREAAQAQRDGDLALLGQHPALPDDLRGALARLIG